MYETREQFRAALVDAHPDSVGAAIPFAELMVVRPDGSEAAAGEEGELVHAGPLVAQGYWNDPERTAERFIDDETGKPMEVWVDPLTGARRYEKLSDESHRPDSAS